MRYQGEIENWNDERGFGFVTDGGGGGHRAFVHIKAFADRRRRPVDGDVIDYEVEFDVQQRAQAVNVQYKYVGDLLPIGYAAPRAGAISVGEMIGVAFVCTLIAFCVLKITPVFILLIYFAMSCITFSYYALDKLAAKRNHWRTPERTLHALAFFGGWPGALLGQKMFRHKTKKLEFQIVFWLIVSVNCGLFALFLTKPGADMFRSLRAVSESSNENGPSATGNDDRLPRIVPLPTSSDP